MMNLVVEQTYAADGSFRGMLTIGKRDDASRDTWALVGKVTLAGTWAIDGDVCTETLRTMSVPMMPLPSTDKDRITRIQPDEFTSVSLQSGKVTVRQRKPMAGSQHAQAFSQPWPELVATAQWQTLTIDDEGTYSYDPVSLQRVGDIVWGWVRFDMSPKALQNAREMAAKNTTGAPSLILERVYTFFLVDCRLQWIKPREIRIHMDGRLAAGSKYENADPTDWSRILSEDAGKSAVAQQMCEQQ